MGRSADRGPVRQFRVTVTEDPNSPSLSVSLSWRTFPCVASHWDGHATAEVLSEARPIEHQAALRQILEALAASEWEGRTVPR